MNCRPGDLAVVVGNGPLSGRFVTVTHIYYGSLPDRPEWCFAPDVYWPAGNQQLTFFDDRLRPIRDTDGEDETLTWKCGKAPKVEPVTQPETMSWWPS